MILVETSMHIIKHDFLPPDLLALEHFIIVSSFNSFLNFSNKICRQFSFWPGFSRWSRETWHVTQPSLIKLEFKYPYERCNLAWGLTMSGTQNALGYSPLPKTSLFLLQFTDRRVSTKHTASGSLYRNGTQKAIFTIDMKNGRINPPDI